ncbi:DUF502 domain-containing protein [Bacillus massilinigeriensis]|uniref:DUF502 domain-containing protein n=1 Tax=Bacillus mediterraneensis TaxID=1805474 RepID=UPI0008F8E55D|nr:DUF502 domain-containing protein [Bacillus mediterraneensis]
MKKLFKNFLNGILTIVPIILVIFVCYKTFMFLDGLLGSFLEPFMKNDYIPGFGLLLTLILITLLGWLSTRFITGTIVRITDRILDRIPIVKTIYSVIKDTLRSFLGEKKSFSIVVLVTIPATGMKSMGFITADDLAAFYSPLEDYAAVYIPQTFQVAGFTFFVRKDELEVLNVKPEDAMKFILSGGMTAKKTSNTL